MNPNSKSGLVGSFGTAYDWAVCMALMAAMVVTSIPVLPSLMEGRLTMPMLVPVAIGLLTLKVCYGDLATSLSWACKHPRPSIWLAIGLVTIIALVRTVWTSEGVTAWVLGGAGIACIMIMMRVALDDCREKAAS